MDKDGSLTRTEAPTPPPAAPAWGPDHCLTEEQWARFRTYLARRPREVSSVVLSIAEIERIIDRKLPAEAGLPQWWATTPRLGKCGPDGGSWAVSGMRGHYLVEIVRC